MSDTKRREQTPGEVRSVQGSDGARLEYEVVGDGPPLLMLHGVLTGRFSFSRQRNEFAKHYRLIILSARGHDGSDSLVPANYGVGSSDVEDLCAVLDTEQIDRVNLFGHSSGGATAFVFSCRYPERVIRAVLIEPTLYSIMPSADRVTINTASMTVAATAEAEGPEAGLRAAMELAGGQAWRKLDADAQAKRLQAMATSAPVHQHCYSMALTVFRSRV